jgi:hypothetical protein
MIRIRDQVSVFSDGDDDAAGAVNRRVAGTPRKSTLNAAVRNWRRRV